MSMAQSANIELQARPFVVRMKANIQLYTITVQFSSAARQISAVRQCEGPPETLDREGNSQPDTLGGNWRTDKRELASFTSAGEKITSLKSVSSGETARVPGRILRTSGLPPIHRSIPPNPIYNADCVPDLPLAASWRVSRSAALAIFIS